MLAMYVDDLLSDCRIGITSSSGACNRDSVKAACVPHVEFRAWRRQFAKKSTYDKICPHLTPLLAKGERGAETNPRSLPSSVTLRPPKPNESPGVKSCQPGLKDL